MIRRIENFHRALIFVGIFFLFFLTADISPAYLSKERIISLTPATTEILFALGLGDSVVGVSSFCNWPAEAALKPKVGTFSNPNIEKILSLKPDLVLLTGMEQAYLKSILTELKIDYIIVDPSSIDELLQDIKRIGSITSKDKQAQALIKDINDTIKDISRRVSKRQKEKKPKVYIEIWYDPIMSAGKGSFVNDMIKIAGGENITSDLPRSFSRVDPEEVIIKDPDVIILTYMKSAQWIDESFSKRIGFDDIEAVRNDRVVADINPDIILRPGPRVGQGLRELYRSFYEE
jgi:iron complex transport system substrate-binding protein